MGGLVDWELLRKLNRAKYENQRRVENREQWGCSRTRNSRCDFVLINQYLELFPEPSRRYWSQNGCAQNIIQTRLQNVRPNCNMFIDSRKDNVSADTEPSLLPLKVPQRHISMPFDRLVIPIRKSSFPPYESQPTHFLPLFLMPWEPVLRGPLLPFVFAASSALALASVQMRSAWYMQAKV